MQLRVVEDPCIECCIIDTFICPLVQCIHHRHQDDGTEALVVEVSGPSLLLLLDCHMLAIYGPTSVVEVPLGPKIIVPIIRH